MKLRGKLNEGEHRKRERGGEVKTCNGGYCKFKIQDGCFQSCSYEGYCDYQTPKDSRMQPFLGQDVVYKLPYPHEYCPHCHLPLSQCPGHTTCKSDEVSK